MPKVCAQIPRRIQLLFGINLLLAVLFLLGSVLELPTWYLKQVDLDGETNLPTWYSSMQLLLVGCLFFILALDRRSVDTRLALGLSAVGFLFALLSLDEVACLHERIGSWSDALLPGGSREQTALARTGFWMFLVGPVFLSVAAGMAWMLWEYLQQHRKSLGLLTLGFSLFFLSAVGIEILSNWTHFAGGWANTLQILCEELGEMMGVTLMGWGAYSLLSEHEVRLAF